MKNFFYVIIAVAVIGLAGYFMLKGDEVDNKVKDTNISNDNADQSAKTEGKIVNGDINMEGAIATLYYGDGCPHCTNIEKWFTESGYLPKTTPINQSDVDSWISNAKVKFNIKEVWYNKANSAELSKNASELGLEESAVGVPFLYDSVNKKSFVGETDIKKFFQSK